MSAGDRELVPTAGTRWPWDLLTGVSKHSHVLRERPGWSLMHLTLVICNKTLSWQHTTNTFLLNESPTLSLEHSVQPDTAALNTLQRPCRGRHLGKPSRSVGETTSSFLPNPQFTAQLWLLHWGFNHTMLAPWVLHCQSFPAPLNHLHHLDLGPSPPYPSHPKGWEHLSCWAASKASPKLSSVRSQA